MTWQHLHAALCTAAVQHVVQLTGSAHSACEPELASAANKHRQQEDGLLFLSLITTALPQLFTQLRTGLTREKQLQLRSLQFCSDGSAVLL
eukprot:6781-Heterococcus_DN1.PRE.3